MTEHGAAPHLHHPGLDTLIYPGINFVLYVGILLYFLRGPVIEYFRDRACRLRHALEAGERARQDAAEMQASMQRDLADLPRRREAMKAEMLETAQRRQELLVVAARETGARIRRDAETLATQEAAAARLAIRRDLVDAAMRQATETVRASITPEDQERFVGEFVERAGSL